MDFARGQLSKYGWKEGKGLGKDEAGIKEPLRPKLKFDNSGIGHDPWKELTSNWWSDVYDSAAAKVTVSPAHDGNLVIRARMKKKKREKEAPTFQNGGKETKKSLYKNFVKKETLHEFGVVEVNGSKDGHEHEQPTTSKIALPSDEDILEKCKGRTMHRGARHGLNQTGKLKRLNLQERRDVCKSS
ncbi:unnamed protein product [Darwinula stevensoni]|uniref:G patch domain-containing protein 4 n=1 Tax=Darwinula stevensoni TaxID=69355 RepID=A0A7R8ZYU9_9CRUS|nr:unnamed protein product [Darwinula stevensoni]CAG0882242.1 unnamed protein product [Darwinula stevensoni]